jgi:hypothetical protein
VGKEEEEEGRGRKRKEEEGRGRKREEVRGEGGALVLFFMGWEGVNLRWVFPPSLGG